MKARDCRVRWRAHVLGAVGLCVSCGPAAEETSSEPASATLTLDAFAVAPGAEVYKCQNFANPFLEEVYVKGFASEMTPGSHHLLVGTKAFYSDTALEECSGTEGLPAIYAAQVPSYESAFPEGVALRFPKTHGFRVQVHYLNTSTEYLKVQTELIVKPTSQESVQHEAAILFDFVTAISVAPNSEGSVSDSCVSPFEKTLINFTGHMHKHGRRLTIAHGESLIYESMDWAEPPVARFDPPLFIAPSEPLNYRCDYVNDTSSTLTFGESANTNEMCVIFGYFYPAPANREPFGIPCE